MGYLATGRARGLGNLHFQSHPLVGNDMGSFPLEGSDSGSFYFYLELGGLLNVQILHR